MRVSGVMAVPEVSVWAPGSATVTVLSTVQSKTADPWASVLSVAVSVTEYGVALPVVGVPEMVPVVGSMLRPGGRPVADQPVMVPPPMTVAVGTSGVMAVPEVEVWGPGSVTVTTSSTVHVNVSLVPVNPAESVAVAVTG